MGSQITRGGGWLSGPSTHLSRPQGFSSRLVSSFKLGAGGRPGQVPASKCPQVGQGLACGSGQQRQGLGVQGLGAGVEGLFGALRAWGSLSL